MLGIASVLANAGLNLLSDLIDNGKEEAVKVIENKTGVKLKPKLTKVEIDKLKEFEQNNQKLLLEELKTYIKDKESARKMQVELSKSNSWLLKHTGSIIALITIICGFSMFALLLEGKFSIDNPNVALIAGFVGGYITNILSFYFGSSKNEADKAKL